MPICVDWYAVEKVGKDERSVAQIPTTVPDENVILWVVVLGSSMVGTMELRRESHDFAALGIEIYN